MDIYDNGIPDNDYKEKFKRYVNNRLESLAKENAELKGEASSVLDNWCKGDDPCPHLKKRDDQLTKAKEIINNLMVLAVMDFREYEEAYKEAEQFLKEVNE